MSDGTATPGKRRRRWLSMAAALLAVPPGLVPARAAPALDIGEQRQVFIDGRFLQDSRGVTLTVVSPVKEGIVLRANDPARTRIGQYGSVLATPDGFMMWYNASTRIGKGDQSTRRSYVCVARSEDGVHWTKPKLDLAESMPGAEPNIVVGWGAGGFPGNVGEPGNVFLDPNAPPTERFRLGMRDVVMDKTPGKYPLHLLSSPDGIHWRETQRVLINYDSPRPDLDSENVVFWDPTIRAYRAYVRDNLHPPGGRNRAVAYAKSPDLRHFPLVENMRIVLANDGLDPRAVVPGTGRQIRIVDYYTNATVRYPWAQDAYYMFPSAYYHYDRRVQHEFRNDQPKNSGVLDIRFAASRDGIHWRRFSRKPYVRLGPQGTWDSQRLYLYRGLLSAGPTKVYLYYFGSDRNHGWGRDARNRRLLRAAGLAPRLNTGAVGLLELRRDGFVAARAAYGGGQFTTPLLRFRGNELVLNVNTSASGTARVAVLDQYGSPLPGYSLADCDRVFSTNEINRVVTWHGSPDVSSLAGRPVRLHFVMRDTDLYAFQFRNGKGKQR